MKRLLSIAATFISSVLCLAFSILWLRSHRISDGYFRDDGQATRRELVSYAGGLHIRESRHATVLGGNLYYILHPPLGAHRIRELVPAGAKWTGRYPASPDQIVWEKCGLAIASGQGNTPNTSMLLLSGFMPANTAWPTNLNGRVNANVGLPAIYQPNNTAFLPAYQPNNTANVGMGFTTLQNTTFVPAMTGSHMTIVLPYWLLVALTALLPASLLLRTPAALRTRRRRKKGLCLHCGYDLRASRDRCPECGLLKDSA